MSRNFELLQRLEKDDVANPLGEVSRLQPPIPFPALKGPAKEEIVRLVQHLFLHGSDAYVAKTVCFSAMAREDRSSWVCAHAAELLSSRSNGSVCLVDANFASPSLDSQYDLANRGGLAASLVKDGAILAFATQIACKNLWVLPAGRLKPGAELNESRCRARLAELHEKFEFVLVNAPSFLRESEAISLGQMSDGVVLVVEANQTRRDSLRQVKTRLEAAQVKLLGTVLDQRKFPTPRFLDRLF